MLAVAGSAMAQGEATAASTLHMRIVPVDVTSASPLNLSFQNDSTHNTVGATDTNRTRRFSVQYQISEGAGFETFIASLASMQFSITSSVAGSLSSGPSFARSVLTARQAGASTSVAAVLATDTSGNATGAANINRQGLHGAFRGGLSPATQAGNTLPSNGTIVAGGINLITPLTLSQLAQNPSNDTNAWYGIFDFEVTVGDGLAALSTVNLGINVAVDAQTQNAWGAYEDGDVIPRTSRLFTTAGASFDVVGVPAPGAVALLGLGGLVAGRRRRA